MYLPENAWICPTNLRNQKRVNSTNKFTHPKTREFSQQIYADSNNFYAGTSAASAKYIMSARILTRTMISCRNFTLLILEQHLMLTKSTILISMDLFFGTCQPRRLSSWRRLGMSPSGECSTCQGRLTVTWLRKLVTRNISRFSWPKGSLILSNLSEKARSMPWEAF